MMAKDGLRDGIGLLLTIPEWDWHLDQLGKFQSSQGSEH